MATDHGVDCQLCGDVVASAEWRTHLDEHHAGKRETLPALKAFERNANLRRRRAAEPTSSQT